MSEVKLNVEDAVRLTDRPTSQSAREYPRYRCQGDLAVGVERIFDHIMKGSNHSPRLIAGKLGGDPQRMKDVR